MMETPRVALLEARMGSELAALVRRHGGDPVIAPAVSELPVEAGEAVAELVEALGQRSIEFVIFLTGVGALRLFSEADRIGLLPELLSGLSTTTNISRGQKPWQPLKRMGVPISVTVPDPYTTDMVIGTLRQFDLAGRGVALIHYGERNQALTAELTGRAARLLEVMVYEWRMPDDPEPLRNVIGEIVAGSIDALAITSQVQVRHLMEVAESLGAADGLARALNGPVLVAAVGPTSAHALEEAGITPDVVPDHPKMGPMVVAMMESLTRSRTVANPGELAVPDVTAPAPH